jgi:DNA-directed RNA polymerase I subunit RPA2
MEDAMIINKGAYERGFAHGCVYKSYIHELNDQQSGNQS